ncbi:MAG: ribosome silencing factor [Anaerolineaceae bacterium]|nr:ribosome silencing factor [Anaerolineaceae bacterium]
MMVLDLEGVSPVTDFFVIATGTSRRQMGTVLAKIEEFIKSQPEAGKPIGTEGMDSDRWALIDLFDVIVHVFAPEARSFYALELLWGDAPRVDWQDGWQRPGETDEVS